MKSKRSSNLSLNATSRRKKRNSKTKRNVLQLLIKECKTNRPVIRRFGTPRSINIKRKGSFSPFRTLTSPKRYSPSKRTPKSRPRPPKLRKKLFEDNVGYECTSSISDDAEKSIPEIQNQEDMISDICDISVLWEQSFHALHEAGLDQTLFAFLKEFSDGRFPPDNLALRLFADVVKWFSCKQTTEMRYSRESKMFWKLGCRLFGGRFLHFMGGSKHAGSSVLNSNGATDLDPSKSCINFAVPSENILREFDPYCLQKNISDYCPPGVLNSMIDHLKKNINDASCCLTFDGKKLKQGLTQTSGDIDLFGFEPKESLLKKHHALEEMLKPIQQLQDIFSTIDSEHLSSIESDIQKLFLDKINCSLKQISLDILDVKDIRTKKKLREAETY
ncbi:hypothetical protein DPMN_027871 [Dreissena polymorpha]|uniref:Uncharacterized protein n=1 Tax=Dreissena polymorpha TaxID=45954 RepID=A0A9D4RFL4_DREPO|nr:hypothetical protein DPMN_027871 [Dreissena polymorpha]